MQKFHSDLNFNQKIGFEFRTQGLSGYCVSYFYLKFAFMKAFMRKMVIKFDLSLYSTLLANISMSTKMKTIKIIKPLTTFEVSIIFLGQWWKLARA